MAPQKQHQRAISQGKKPSQTNARPKPPALYRRGHSANSVPTMSGPVSNRRSLLGATKKAFTEIIDGNESEELGTASFLQFCATCEKQIVSPGSNILYCSEACREKDATTQLTHYDHLSSSSSSVALAHARQPSSTSNNSNSANILPQRSPTVLRPLSQTFSDLSTADTLAEDDSSSSSLFDFDPFGYECPHDDYEHYHDRSSSNNHNLDHSSPPSHRHNKSHYTSSDALPSLSHTPSSSVGTAVSVHPHWPSRAEPSHHYSHQNYHHHHQRSSSSAAMQLSRIGSKGVDLVTPCFYPADGRGEHENNDARDHTERFSPSRSHRRQSSHQPPSPSAARKSPGRKHGHGSSRS